MKNKSTNTQLKFNGSVKGAYFSYLFSSFWKHPVGYVVAIIYLLFISIILLVVPKWLNKEPLFIWNLTSFNIPLFTLLFIAASCAASAVTVFRVSRDDGTELSLSAKPLTKTTMIGFKTLLYLIISLAMCLLSVAIAALVLPVFGEATSTNTNGIEMTKYKSLILSMFVGNIINICLFSGISVFMTMVGGQVITMVATLGIAFFITILNFVFGKVAKKPSDVVSEQYNTQMITLRTYTKKQVEGLDDSLEAKSFASIQCYVNDEGQELNHYDTNEYWSKIEKQSGYKAYAYLDIGNQLSSFYSGFGLESDKLTDALHLPIGYNSTYSYTIDPNTHVGSKENLEDNRYPLGIYSLENRQGKYYPTMYILGSSNTGVANPNYLISLASSIEYDAVSRISSNLNGYQYPLFNLKGKVSKLSYTLKDLILTPDQQTETKHYFHLFWESGDTKGEFFNKNLTTSESGIWEGNYNDLDINGKFLVNSKLVTYLILLMQEKQNEIVIDYLSSKYPEQKFAFPFTSAQINEVYWNSDVFQYCMNLGLLLTSCGFNIGSIDSNKLYSQCSTSSISYSESFSNLYEFHIKGVISFPALLAAWASIAFILFTTAIIVYKKTDFK